MRGHHRIIMKLVALAAGGSAMVTEQTSAADLMLKAPHRITPSAYDWTGFYVGGHAGMAWGSADWRTPGNLSGSFNLYRGNDIFEESGSYSEGVQVGYDRMLPSRVVLGVVANWSFSTFPALDGVSTGGISTLTSPVNGPETFAENVIHFGSIRARLGYSPGSWLFYATAGFAWTYDQQTLTQLSTGTADMPFLWRLGWAAGAGVEVPVAPHWTAGLEYLFTGFGNKATTFPTLGEQFSSNFSVQQVRTSLNYRFDEKEMPETTKNMPIKAPAAPAEDWINFHSQLTFVWQGFPTIRQGEFGQNSLPASGEGRETTDVAIFAGMRLWQGAELWINPEIDQGFGFNNSHGAAGFPSAEAFKAGHDYPYARVQRFFLRQTIDLGGETQKVDPDLNVFAGSQTANRLVLTVGRYTVFDLFDTNKYANNPKTDFLNWTSDNAGTFDNASDGWGYTFGAAAEWYQDRWTLRAGVFDMTVTPSDAASPAGGYLDNSFDQFQLVGEIEERHELWGQPGKLKVTGYLTRGRMGFFQDAVDLAALTGTDVDTAITALRTYTSKPGVSVNLEQQVNETLGVFARAGWADGNVESWNFTDVDRTFEAGVSFKGMKWGRPDDTVGIAGIINGITSVQQAFYNAGGLGILVGDGTLPRPGLEHILETYYSYALSSSTTLTFDYQLIVNPGYNTDNGPVNVFTGRLHWQF